MADLFPALDMIGFVVLGLVAIVVAIILLQYLRVIVPVKYADVVTRKRGIVIYSADENLTNTGKPNPVYYRFPSWMPVIGVNIKRMPLTIIEIPINDYKTFAKGNARFSVSVSVYCRIKDVLESAQKFPGDTVEDFKNGIREIIVSALRKTTAGFAVEDVIGKRQEIADGILAEIKDDFEKWGVELTNVAVVDIKDPFKTTADGKVIIDKSGEPQKETTVIHDISAKKEAEINSLSRQEIANKTRAALITEAEADQASKTRRIEADEAIAKREQEKNQAVAIMQQEATIKEMEVERTKKVTMATIEADAAVKRADGEKRAAIERANGEREKSILEGQGHAAAIEVTGTAEAEVIRQKKTAEADGLMKLADAQKKQQESALQVRIVEKDERVGLAQADALRNAKIEYIGSGAPKDLMDFFTPGGGMSAGAGIGTFLRTLKKTNPDGYDEIVTVVNKVTGGMGNLINKFVGDEPVTAEPVETIVQPVVTQEPVQQPDMGSATQKSNVKKR